MKPERTAGYWSSIGIACLTAGLAFGFVRYRFNASPPVADVKPEDPIPKEIRQVRVNDPILPRPPAKYKVLKAPSNLLIEWADNGTALWMNGGPENRTYTVRTLDGRITKYDKLKPEDRISLSQGGRVFQFKMPYPGAIGGFRRLGGGFGVGYDMILSSNRSALAYVRRFTNEGAYIGLNSEGKFYALGEYVAGKLVRTIHRSKNGFWVMDRSPEGDWFIYDIGESKKFNSALFVNRKSGVTTLAMPEKDAMLRAVAHTKGRTLVTISVREDKKLEDRLYELQGAKFRRIATPKPFQSILVQKITNDGYVIGNAELSPGQHVPIAIRNGKLYDLRRLPEWPNEWVDTYVAGVNRRGDIYVGTTSPGPNGDLQFRMLQRLDAE